MYNSNMNMCRKYKSDKIIKNILENYFEEFKKLKWHRVRKEMRQHIKDIVERSLNCGNIGNGYIKHKCLECKEEYIHGFTCKTKFCSKCGRLYSLKWSNKQIDNMLNVTHRHAVFTISEELRNYFYKNRELLKDLQDAVYVVVSSYYQNKVKGSYEVGLIAVVHTSESDLKWNPHIHALFTEGGIDKNNKWFKKVSHIHYKFMRKSWQKLVLDIIKKNFTDIRTKRLVNKLYKKYNEGFYVNTERDLTNIKQAIKYIGRYLARPAIAEYRVIRYDGKSVTFWYENKKPKKKITVTIDVLEFIGKLTQHIYPKGFRVVRRYGLYARSKNRLSIEIIKLYNFIKQRNIYEIINKINTKKMSFKERLIETFGVNPFKCSNCDSDMILWEVWHHKYGVIYDALDKTNYRILIDDIEKENIKEYTIKQLALF